MNDWSDWAENRAPPASPRWRWVPRVAVVLALLAAVAYLAYVVAELGDRAMRVADDFIAHTTHSTTSPDGHWSLLIDSVNTGALGGSTRVNLRPVTADDDAQGVTLFDGNWRALRRPLARRSHGLHRRLALCALRGARRRDRVTSYERGRDRCRGLRAQHPRAGRAGRHAERPLPRPAGQPLRRDPYPPR